MKSIIAAGVVGLLAFAPPIGAAVPAVNVAPWVARQVDPKVHVLATPEDYYGPAIGNVSIIEQGDGYVLVDSGLTAGNGRAVVAYVRALSAKPVKAVIFSHWHNDHPQGATEVLAAWPKARLIATEETKKGLLGPAQGAIVGLTFKPEHEIEIRRQIAESVAKLDKLIADPATAPDRKARAAKAKLDYAQFLEGYRGTHITPPTETFRDRLSFPDRDAPVEVLFLGRANTAGDAVTWLPKQKIAMSGDIVVSPTPFGFFSFPSDWIQTLGRLKALGFRLLVPGHGQLQTDTAYVDQLIAGIEDIRAQVGPLAKQGMSLEEVGKKVDYTRTTATFAPTDRLKPRFKAYWLDPMTENAWKEAQGKPIIQGEGEVTVAKQAPAARKN
jgi:glyoxylase-like metal-dependent hydrolase (beta-lactamase superfamily II)